MAKAYWKATKADLDAISGLATGDVGFVIESDNAITFYRYGSSSWEYADDITTAKVIPPTDSTTAIQLTNAAGSTTILTVDTTNSRIGINDTSPSYSLDVTGTAQITTSLITPIIKPASDSTTAIQLQNAAGTAVVNVDTTNSRVGIGTTSPQQQLHVSKSGTSASFTLQRSDVNNGWGLLADADFYLNQNGVGTPLTVQATSNNFGLNTTTFGTTLAKGISIGEGTPATAKATDAVQLWVANQNGAGTDALYLMNEAAQSGVVAHQAPLQNLLTNSGFKCWSNGTLEDVGTQISITGISSGVCATANTQGLAVGKLFRFDGGTVTGTYEVTAVTANTSFTINDTSKTEASAHTGYEVTPGLADNVENGPDGWARTTGTSVRPFVYREQGTVKSGAFYSLRMVSQETSAMHQIYWPAGVTTKTEHLEHFRGRTVTFGCWVKADAASMAKIGINDSGVQYKSAFNAGTDWEWLEVTLAVASDATTFNVHLTVETTGHTVYFSQPMLVYGPSLGAGNAAESKDIVWCEQPISSDTLHNKTGFSDTSATTLNLETDSSGKIPKGAKAVYVRARVNDVDSTNAVKSLQLRSDSSQVAQFEVVSSGLAADGVVSQQGWQKCDANGDIQYTIEASASGTLDIPLFQILGVEC